MLVGRNPEFIVEAVVPDLLHVIPVVDNTVFDGISEFEDSLLCLSFFSHIGLLIHADHDVLVLGTADD